MHNHILFNIDDGSESLEESIKMLHEASKAGITDILASPHFIPGYSEFTEEEYEYRLMRLVLEAKTRGISIKIHHGCEFYYDPSIFRRIRENRIKTINSTKYMLVELPMYGDCNNVDQIVYEIRSKGIIPVVAHPERIFEISDDETLCHKLVENGALLQLNLPSLLGRFGNVAMESAEKMLKYQLYHMVGTDMHSSKNQFIKIKTAMERLEYLTSPAYFEKITKTNASRVLMDKNVEANEFIIHPFLNNKKIITDLSLGWERLN